MPEEPKPALEAPAPPTAVETTTQQDVEDAGDFITRHVLEKDSVFFEG